MMIFSLADRQEFRRLRRLAWERNIDYWLSGQLRHVADVGGYICDRVKALCNRQRDRRTVLVDMGFGSAWLLSGLLEELPRLSYLGLDNTRAFVNHALASFASNEHLNFLLTDVETRLDLPIHADVVVNAFNFFELCDLRQAMENVARLLIPGGTLFMSTIDKTYLILALSETHTDFLTNLARYQELPGTKFGFQRIDLGPAVSHCLEYPSVLYSTQDFIDVAHDNGLRLVSYVEQPFTATVVPKIYCHLEFQRTDAPVHEE